MGMDLKDSVKYFGVVFAFTVLVIIILQHFGIATKFPTKVIFYFTAVVLGVLVAVLVTNRQTPFGKADFLRVLIVIAIAVALLYAPKYLLPNSTLASALLP